MILHNITPWRLPRSRGLRPAAIALGFLLLAVTPPVAVFAGNLTLSFTNSAAITIYGDQSYGSPYPSTIQVPALPGALQSMTVTIYGLTDPLTDAIDLLLTCPDVSGQAVDLMNYAGNGGTSNATIRFADSGTPFSSSAAITTGTYQPSGTTFSSSGYDPFFPQDSTTNNLAGFIGTSLAGTWSLYEYFSDFSGSGSISGGWSMAFTLGPAAPSVATLAASAVTTTNATLNASVNPNLGPTTVSFKYGPTTAYGNSSPATILSSDLVDSQAVAMTITGLPPGSTNHFQAVASNSAGTNFGGDVTFVTSSPPPPVQPVLDAVFTNGDQLILMLSGNPGSNYLILISTNLAFPIHWSVLTNITLTNPVQYINPGLPPNQTAFFDLASVPPTVTTLAASAIQSAGATLNATVNPDGGLATVFFAFGPTSAYGNVTASTNLSSGLDSAQAVALAATGLAPGTTNHFQAVVQNGLGTNFGGDLTFVTAPAPPVLAASLPNNTGFALVLSGTPTYSYSILVASNLTPTVNWATLTNLTLTNATQTILLGLPTNAMQYYRAVQE